nr:MAG: capsid protein precursor [Astroviridae sp.]
MASKGAAPKEGLTTKKKPQKPHAKPKTAPKKKQKKTKTQPIVKEVKKVEKKVKKLQKKTNGPKIDDKMTTTVTVGTLVGQASDGLNRQIRVPFNPLLMKASEGSNTTPLSIRGSMYEMWKVLHAEVKATPLSGYSNVVGSVGFMALTLNGLEAGADSIDSVKARKHVQMPLGRAAQLRLSARDLEGPREGWWLVDTSLDPAEAYGPAIDLLLAYQTQNLLNTSGHETAYTGTLWQIEMRVTYAFSTYHPKPGLQSLVAETLSEPATVTVKNGEDGSLIMETDNVQLLSLFDKAERHYQRSSAQTGGKSQTIWAVAGAAVEATATVMGPWGWLLRGGFWLVRKIFGPAGRNATTQFQIYPSITAASEDQPIYGGSGTQTINMPVVHVSEVVNPNSEYNVATDPSTRNQLPPQPALPFRPAQQPAPVYACEHPEKISRSWVSGFFFGNWRWQTYSQDSPFNYNCNGFQLNKKACAYAHLTEFQGMVAGAVADGSSGPGGILGTAYTWVLAMKEKHGQGWWPGNLTTPEIRLPSQVNLALGFSGAIYGGAVDIFAPVKDNAKELSSTGYLLWSQNGGASVIVFMNTDETTMSQKCLLGPVVVAAAKDITWTGHSLNTITPPSAIDDDDDISIAESFLGFDESDCSKPQNPELERELLIRRLRELDLTRFGAG